MRVKSPFMRLICRLSSGNMRVPAFERRKENVRVLLRTLNDVYPGPATLALAVKAGPGPGRRVPCTFCHRTGRAYAPAEKRAALCPVCDGAGWRTRRAGEPEYDEYTGLLVATGDGPVRAKPMSPERLEAEIARVQHELRLTESGFDPEEQYSWERARMVRDRDASYRELERVLDVMQIELPLGRSLINSLYLGGITVGVSLGVRRLEDELVGWIALRMRGKVRVPLRYWKAQREELQRQIRQLDRLGVDERRIAEELGVSVGRVRNEIAAKLRADVADARPSKASAPETVGVA